MVLRPARDLRVPVPRVRRVRWRGEVLARGAGRPRHDARRGASASTPPARTTGVRRDRSSPPSTGSITPVRNDAAGESRNAATAPELLRFAVAAQRDARLGPLGAASSGSPVEASSSATRSVAMRPGRSPLTRTPCGPSSSANVLGDHRQAGAQPVGDRHLGGAAPARWTRAPGPSEQQYGTSRAEDISLEKTDQLSRRLHHQYDPRSQDRGSALNKRHFCSATKVGDRFFLCKMPRTLPG